MVVLGKEGPSIHHLSLPKNWRYTTHTHSNTHKARISGWFHGISKRVKPPRVARTEPAARVPPALFCVQPPREGPANLVFPPKETSTCPFSHQRGGLDVSTTWKTLKSCLDKASNVGRESLKDLVSPPSEPSAFRLEPPPLRPPLSWPTVALARPAIDISLESKAS